MTASSAQDAYLPSWNGANDMLAVSWIGVAAVAALAVAVSPFLGPAYHALRNPID